MRDHLRAVPDEPEDSDERSTPRHRPERRIDRIRREPPPWMTEEELARREAMATPLFPRSWQRAIWLLVLGGFAVVAFLRACGVEI